MRVAIHQANFVPHYPFFQKMESVDTFIILTQCQYEKGGYQNRFNIGEDWYTMGVEKGIKPICEKQYLNPVRDFDRLKRKLPKYRHILKLFDHRISRKVGFTNSMIIFDIHSMLQLKTSLFFDHPTILKGTDRLVDLCKRHGATTYLAGPSGANYMEFEKFHAAGIRVEFQENRIMKPILEVLAEKL